MKQLDENTLRVHYVFLRIRGFSSSAWKPQEREIKYHIVLLITDGKMKSDIYKQVVVTSVLMQCT